MTVMLFVRLSLFGGGLLLLVSGLALRNRGGEQRCPKCRYDVSKAAQERCSECGYEWRSREELHRRPRRPSRLIAGSIALVLAAWLTLFGGSDWTSYLPRPVLSGLLHVLAPHQPIAPGAALPAPDPALMHSTSRWKRLIWQKQAARAAEHFLTLVEQSDGTIEAAENLVPAVLEMSEIYKQYGGTRWVDAFPLKNVQKRARKRATAIDSALSLPLGTWAAAELQHHSSTSVEYPNWITPPLEVIGPLSQSNDAEIRKYALRRLTNMKGPQAKQYIEAMLDDPDESLARYALDVLLWRWEFRGWE